MSYARRIAGDQFSSACVGRAGAASGAAAAPSWDDRFVRRFVYKIEPASLIPRDAEYIFESEEELKAGDILERVGRHLFVERVEDDDSNSETETSAISRTLHCRLEVDPDAWPGEEDWAGDGKISRPPASRPRFFSRRLGRGATELA